VGAANWNVDIDHPDKPLTVTNTDKKADEISAAIKKLGFKAELVEKQEIS
jgi:phage replication-related protein YjqB (UPF0714/DUF867 family)